MGKIISLQIRGLLREIFPQTGQIQPRMIALYMEASAGALPADQTDKGRTSSYNPCNLRKNKFPQITRT